jgi:hypothetical protein
MKSPVGFVIGPVKGLFNDSADDQTASTAKARRLDLMG